MSVLARLRAHHLRLHAAARTSVGRLRLVYFLYFAAAGTAVPFLAKYLVGRGFTGAQIGSIQMLPSLLAPFVAMLWASAAERGGDPVRIIRWITGWAALSALLLPFAATPLLVGAVVFSQSLGDRAIVPMLDAVSLDHCRAHPEVSYARIRMFGSIGFFVLAFGLGQVLTWRGNRPGDPVVPATIAGLAACYALAARRLAPAPTAHAVRPGLRDLAGLLGNRRLLLLLGACAVHWAACAPYSQFLAVFVDGLGLPPSVAGTALMVGVLAEVGAMMSFPAVERRASPRTLLAVAFLASALRWALLARATSGAAVIALQLLHGLTYGLYWSALVKQVGALVPPRIRATGLALTAAVVNGAGTAVGAKLSGLGFDRYRSVGPVFLWSAGADLALAAVILLLLARRALAEEEPAERAA
jgi:PPP family 3-phenylpropionic acid transporter